MVAASTWTTAKGSTRRGVEVEFQLGPVNVSGSYSVKATAENVKRPRPAKRQQVLPLDTTERRHLDEEKATT